MLFKSYGALSFSLKMSRNKNVCNASAFDYMKLNTHIIAVELLETAY